MLEGMDPEVELCYALLFGAVSRIDGCWLVVLRARETDLTDVCMFAFPSESGEPEDLSDSEIHPDRILVTINEGILFLKPTITPRSQWMAAQLRGSQELAGRVI